MINHPAMRAVRLDGLEAMLCAVAFIATTTLLLLLRVALPIRWLGTIAVAAGVAAVWLLRRFRPTRAPSAQDGEQIVGARSLASLLLLGVLFLPAVPLLIGSGLVYAGLRVGRARARTTSTVAPG